MPADPIPRSARDEHDFRLLAIERQVDQASAAAEARARRARAQYLRTPIPERTIDEMSRVRSRYPTPTTAERNAQRAADRAAADRAALERDKFIYTEMHLADQRDAARRAAHSPQAALERLIRRIAREVAETVIREERQR